MKPLFLFCFGLTLLAQEPSPGWHRFGERNDNQTGTPVPQQAQPPAPRPATPLDLTIAAGTWINIRVNEPLSAHHAQPGDSFTASLAEPVIVNGLVVARRGQIVRGRIADATKAGRVKGTSRLGVELTEMALVDGQQISIATQPVERRGDTSVGNDVAAVGVTSAIGAAIGAAAGDGWGAGIGALAGAAAGTTGVLATRGRDTVLYPEQVLTFRLEQPVHFISQAPYAFQPVSAQFGSAAEYDRTTHVARAPLAPPPYPVYPYPVVYPYYGGFFGAGFYGTGFYGRGYYGRGFYGHGYYRR